MTNGVSNLTQVDKEFRKCQSDIYYYFLNYVWLQDRARQKTVKWEPWPHLLDFIDQLLRHRYIIIFKSRQIGASWTLSAYAVWLCLFFENTKVLELSQREDEAWKLLDKSRFIVNHHPALLRPRILPDQMGLLGFPATQSIIEALPSTEDAGRSTDATLVIADEWEYHPYAEVNFAAVKPTIDTGGKFVGVSTINKLKGNSFPKQIWYKAKQKENNFIPLFYPWNVVPTRDQDWYENATRDLSKWQKEQEYPNNEQEALSSPKTIAFFNADAIEAMFQDIMPLYDGDKVDTHNGLVKVYKPPAVGLSYCIFTDPSNGITDPFHTVVMDWKTGEGVAEASGMLPADQCAKIHDELVKVYNNAFNSFEVGPAQAGGAFEETIKLLGTPNICFRVKPDKTLDRTKKAWWTSAGMKKTMLWSLEEAVRDRRLRTHNREAINQFQSFFIPEGEDPQVPSGMHDDAIMAWAGVWQIQKYAPFEQRVRIESGHYTLTR